MTFHIKMNPKLLEEVNAAGSNLWTPPSDAIQKGDTKAWSDLLNVIESKVEQDARTPGREIVRVTFECAAESPREDGSRNPNILRKHIEWFRSNEDAMTDTGHPDRQMTVLTINTLKNLARSVDLLADTDDETDFGFIFESTQPGELPPIVGRKLFGRVRQYRDKTGIMRQSIDRYQSLTTK